MGAILNLVERNLHEVHVDADRMLFHIPSSSLFASDELTGTIIDTLRGPGCSSDDLIQRLAARFNGEEITETLRELMALELVSDGSPLTPDIATKRVERTAINTVVLNVNTGCNLSCTYCYKEDLDKPSAGKKMDVETAIASVEMLLRESPDEERFTVVFFGGEPLSNRKLIEYMVDSGMVAAGLPRAGTAPPARSPDTFASTVRSRIATPMRRPIWGPSIRRCAQPGRCFGRPLTGSMTTPKAQRNFRSDACVPRSKSWWTACWPMSGAGWGPRRSVVTVTSPGSPPTCRYSCARAMPKRTWRSLDSRSPRNRLRAGSCERRAGFSRAESHPGPGHIAGPMAGQ